MIRIVTGDLLDAPVEALVNTVNTVGVMGKGIALQFKRRFPENFKAYERACKHDELAVGRVFTYDYGLLRQPRYVINFPTKEHWRGASRLEYIESGLRDLVRTIAERDIRSIAVPALGCSNGGLAWGDVRPRIEGALGPLREVDVWLYPPLTPGQKNIELRPLKQKPGLTSARALIIKLFALYTAFGDELGRLEAQKLAYFAQAGGVNLRLKFEKQKYGPYAEPLNHVLLRLEGHYIKGYGDRLEASRIQVIAGAVDEAQAVLAADPVAQRAVQRVVSLIDGFETPYGMELLATVHWVVTVEGAADPGSARQAVQQWSERKKLTFSDYHVRAAFDRLAGQGWFSNAGRIQ